MPDVLAAVIPAIIGTTTRTSEPWVGAGRATGIVAQCIVTAASGTTPTLAVTIEDSMDGINWFTIGTIPTFLAAGANVIRITGPFSDLVRAKATIGGVTPSFAYAVTLMLRTNVSYPA